MVVPPRGYPGGVFCSYDNGDTWNDLSSGLPTRYIEKVFISPDNILYVVTYATNRLYRFNDPITKLVFGKDQKVRVYPNPFDNEIFVSTPPGDGYGVTITDLEGQLLKQLNNKKGNCIVPIYLGGLPKGVYILRIYNHENSFVQKIIKN